MKSFLFALIGFSLVIATGNFLFEHFYAAEHPIKHLWALFFFFVFITAVFHSYIIAASKSEPHSFTRKYMVITALRLFLFIAIILIYRLVFGKEQGILFAIAFLAHYLLFTIFEVFILLRLLKSQK